MLGLEWQLCTNRSFDRADSKGNLNSPSRPPPQKRIFYRWGSWKSTFFQPSSPTNHLGGTLETVDGLREAMLDSCHPQVAQFLSPVIIPHVYFWTSLDLDGIASKGSGLVQDSDLESASYPISSYNVRESGYSNISKICSFIVQLMAARTQTAFKLALLTLYWKHTIEYKCKEIYS